VGHLQLLPLYLFLDAEDEVLERAGDHVVRVEELVYGIDEFIVVF
jgi:hypothetical protein